MQEIIKVENIDMNGESVNSVNARDLWEALCSKTDFSTWIKRRLEEIGAVENLDYMLLKNEEREFKGFAAGLNKIDYIITLDVAKHFSMMERNPKGKQVRQYFIELEKQAKRNYQNFLDEQKTKKISYKQSEEFEIIKTVYAANKKFECALHKANKSLYVSINSLCRFTGIELEEILVRASVNFSNKVIASETPLYICENFCEISTLLFVLGETEKNKIQDNLSRIFASEIANTIYESFKNQMSYLNQEHITNTSDKEKILTLESKVKIYELKEKHEEEKNEFKKTIYRLNLECENLNKELLLKNDETKQLNIKTIELESMLNENLKTIEKLKSDLEEKDTKIIEIEEKYQLSKNEVQTFKSENTTSDGKNKKISLGSIVENKNEILKICRERIKTVKTKKLTQFIRESILTSHDTRILIGYFDLDSEIINAKIFEKRFEKLYEELVKLFYTPFEDKKYRVLKDMVNNTDNIKIASKYILSRVELDTANFLFKSKQNSKVLS